jgi:hypothetical protein
MKLSWLEEEQVVDMRLLVAAALVAVFAVPALLLWLQAVTPCTLEQEDQEVRLVA